MNKTNKKILVALPLIAGSAYLVYYFWKRNKNLKENTPLINPPAVPKKEQQYVPAAESKVYPLKRGSKGALVRELQVILGFTGKNLDGAFGPITEKALISAYGKSQIANAADFAAFKNKVQSAKITATKSSRAVQLLNDYNANSQLRVFTTMATHCEVIMVDNNNSYTLTGKNITFKQGEVFTRERMVLKAVASNGYVRAQYTTLFNFAKFDILINPENISLTK